MENQTIIDRGNACFDLLNNPSFTMIFKELMDHYINTCFTSAIEQKDVREAAYFQSRALQDILGVMNQWVSMRDQLIEEKE